MSTQKYSRYICGERIGGQECTSEMHRSQRPTASREHTSTQYHILTPVYISQYLLPPTISSKQHNDLREQNSPESANMSRIRKRPDKILGHSCRASASCFAEGRGMTPLLKREILWEPEQEVSLGHAKLPLWMMGTGCA